MEGRLATDASEQSWTSTSKQYIAEVEAIKEERICFNYKYCCVKSKACLILGAIGLFFEANLIYTVVRFYMHLYEKMHKAELKYPQLAETCEIYVTRALLANIPLWIVCLIKDYYGFRWLLQYRRRKEFMAYYRLNITANSAYSLLDIVIILSNAFDDYQDGIVTSSIGNLFLCIFQIIIVEINMRYMDKLHIVNTEVKRDK